MNLSVRVSPHIRDRDSTERIMWSVVLTLIPAFIGALYIFGWYAGLVTAVCVVACVLTEGVCQALRGMPVRIMDGSAVITGLLLAFCLPPNLPLWVSALGGFIAIAIGKELFGGLGNNIWNPALVGRAVLQLSFPEFINHAQWPILKPEGGFQLSRFAMNINSSVDALTQATPMSVSPAVGASKYGYSFHSLSMWLGMQPGSLGETSFILIAIGGIALILMKRINWRVPVLYIGTVALLTWVFPYSKAEFSTQGFFQGSPLYHVMFGGLALGAFYMATDMVTSPLTSRGQVVFAIGCGVLTAVIRLYGGYPEGVCYSILIMNTAVPLIDRWCRPRVFGTGKAEKAKEA